MLSFDELKLLRAQGALLGLACGDALGTTLEFKPKDSFAPLTDMVGGGPFRLEAGQWTDDTAMMLCLADSLIEKGETDQADQAERYLRWYQHGESSCTGHCFDIGNTVRDALRNYQKTGNPLAGSVAENTAGNGSLMRIAPIALFYADASVEVAMSAAAQSSRVTHGEQRCVEACELMTLLIHRALNTEYLGNHSRFLIQGLADYLRYRHDCHDDIRAICRGGFTDKSRNEIHGTGFVVQSLEAALWCFSKSSGFEQGALLAANLGEDADTTAAIYGQLAGAFYGASEIPHSWRTKLAWQQHIHDTASWLLMRADNRLVRDFIQLTQQQIATLDCHEVPLCSSAYRYGVMVSHINYDLPFERVRFDSLRDFDAWLAKASYRDCVSWLIKAVRAERFCDGAIASSIRDGSMSLLLDRLTELVAVVKCESSGAAVEPLAVIMALITQGELSISGSIRSLEMVGRFLQGKAIELMPLPSLRETVFVTHPLADYEAEQVFGEDAGVFAEEDELLAPDGMRPRWSLDTQFSLQAEGSGLFELALDHGIKLTANVINEHGKQRLTIYEKPCVPPEQLGRSLAAMMRAWCRCDELRHEPQFIKVENMLKPLQEQLGRRAQIDIPLLTDTDCFEYWRGYELGVRLDAGDIQVFEHRTRWTGPHRSKMEEVVVKSFPRDTERTAVIKYLSNRAKRKNPMVICRHCGTLTWADWHMGDGLCESCYCAIKGIIF